VKFTLHVANYDCISHRTTENITGELTGRKREDLDTKHCIRDNFRDGGREWRILKKDLQYTVCITVLGNYLTAVVTNLHAP
jgi:hypothetical protein